mmetsp:Transcript_52289/g.113993  ORF Transcript_52289/g.113993 Transcript_52289/m.113993 type:complete len:118 (-) Transcript_52289:2-355(-)
MFEAPGEDDPAWSSRISRMLVIEYCGVQYDWINLSSNPDLVKAWELEKVMRDNIAHHFKVPEEWQAVFDQFGLVTTNADFRRVLESRNPYLRLDDLRMSILGSAYDGQGGWLAYDKQ